MKRKGQSGVLPKTIVLPLQRAPNPLQSELGCFLCINLMALILELHMFLGKAHLKNALKIAALLQEQELCFQESRVMSLLFEPTTRTLAVRLRFGLGLKDRKGIKHPLLRTVF